MVAVVPHLGYVVNALRGRTIELAAILLAPLALALLVLFEIWGGGERREAAGDERDPGSQPERPRFVFHPKYAGWGS